MSNEFKKKENMYDMYGNYVSVPHSWYRLCRKYIIPKEIKEFKDKRDNSIELNPMEINVLAYLANYDECYVANGTIAEVFKLKKKTIEKYMKELRWVGFIKTFENKENPTYTDRRNIYIQHDAIKKVLEYDSYIYMVPYECGVSNDEVPSTCNLNTLQMECNYPTNVTLVPSTCKTNKKELKYIKNNNKEKVADAPNDEDKSSSHASDDEKPIKSKINYNYSITNISLPMDLNVYENILEQDIRDLRFNSKSHYDIYDDYKYVEIIYDKYIECCSYRKNANDTISSIKIFMKQYNCNEDSIEKCVGYFLYQHRKLKRSIEEIKVDFEKNELVS